MQLNPYLAFNGNCEEALNFYKECLGGEFESINYFKDGPPEMGGTVIPEEMKDRVMHMTWRFDGNVVMASDSVGNNPSGGNISLSVNMDSVEQMETAFAKMSAGGQVTLPLGDTFWGARFGMFTDRFGINWMFNCHKK